MVKIPGVKKKRERRRLQLLRLPRDCLEKVFVVRNNIYIRCTPALDTFVRLVIFSRYERLPVLRGSLTKLKNVI
jgi:hypothetical protein